MRLKLAKVVLACLVAIQTWLPGSALAACDDPNEQIFVAAQSESGAWVERRGTINRIAMKNRDLDTGCIPVPAGSRKGASSLSTAHISKAFSGTEACKQVEIGWREFWEGANTSSQSQSLKDWYVFTEKQVVCDDVVDIQYILAPNLDPGTDDIWRISGNEKTDGTSDWTLAVNFVIGAGYVTVETYNTNWVEGYPQGETERFANGSGMSDHQENLQWKTSAGDWIDWKDNGLRKHVGSLAHLWSYDRASSNSYNIV